MARVEHRLNLKLDKGSSAGDLKRLLDRAPDDADIQYRVTHYPREAYAAAHDELKIEVVWTEEI